MEEGFRLDLEAVHISEDEKHERLKAEEEASIVEEARLKYEEEDLLLKAEDEALLVKEARLKVEQEEQTCF